MSEANKRVWVGRSAKKTNKTAVLIAQPKPPGMAVRSEIFEKSVFLDFSLLIL
jgi:hypothetical protein